MLRQAKETVNETVCFSGVRDSELEALIVKEGGKVVSSVKEYYDTGGQG